MMLVVITLLISSLLSMAAFGFVLMLHDTGHAVSSCIAAIAGGTDCPGAETSLLGLTFHWNLFKYFSTAIFQLLIIAFLLSAAVWLADPTRFRKLSYLNFVPIRQPLDYRQHYAYRFTERFNDWFSTRETRLDR